MSLRPLGHRILVQPDEQPGETVGGLVLPQDRHHVPTSGVVVAIGDGPARDAKIRASVIARCIGIVEEMVEQNQRFGTWLDQFSMDTVAELRRYKNQVEQFEPEIRVGDRVVYPVESGLTITEDGQTYILLNEDDVAVIATDESEAA